MNDAFTELFEVIHDRKHNPQKGSYTCYLFDKGLDKILKKIGEECAESIIAAKNDGNDELKMELCDLIYHVFVLMAEKNLSLEDITGELRLRAAKIGNLKEMRIADRNS